MVKPRVLSAVLHYNSPEQAIRCAESLRRSIGVDLQILIVDNASSEDNYMRLATALPHEVKIRSPVNRGYAGGMNLALKYALSVQADFVLLVTQDVVVDGYAVGILISTMVKNQGCGIVGPVVYSLLWPGYVLSAGGYVNARRVSVGHFRHPIKDTPYIVDWVDGCCMLVNSKLIEQAGGFDERYFMYYEETDLCERARRLGWTIVVSPQAKVWHEENVVPGQAYYYYIMRNAYLYWQSNFGVGFWPVLGRLCATVARHYAASVGSLFVPQLRVGGGVRGRFIRAVRATKGMFLGSWAYLKSDMVPLRLRSTQ